jgi:hypothetical protein
LAASGSSVPCAWPWKIANAATSTIAMAMGALMAKATISPSTTPEAAMPISTIGMRMSKMPSAPPKTIASGNTIGRM